MRKLIKEEPSVDVILPNYNKAKFLEEAINSVIYQTYKNWNLYIIDDHSSDNSFEIINKFLNIKNTNIIRIKKKYGSIVLQKLWDETVKIKIYIFFRF